MPQKQGISNGVKKILYIVTQTQWGGAQKYVYDLATNLNKNEFEPVVAAGEDKNGELFERLAQKEIRTIYLKHLVRAIKPLNDFLGLIEIIKLIKAEKPDIIHLNSTKAGVLGSLAAFLLYVICYRLQVIYTVHGWVFNEPLPIWQKTFYFWAEKITALFKNKLICVSEYDRQTGLRYKIAKEQKLITIHNGVDVNVLKFSERNEAREELFKMLNFESRIKNQESRIIGTIANFYPTKGLNYLIEAADLVRKKFPDIIFVLIGDGQQKNWLKEKIRQLNLNDNFRLIKISDAYQYLKAFDIFVLSSVKEGLPYTILEAMAAELPIVATKVGGIPEMIEDNVSGLLVKPKDSENLAKKISQLLENSDLAKNFARKAKEKYERGFGLEKMIEKTINLYY